MLSAARKSGGFTLVELLIVVVILGVLAAIVLPGLAGSARQTREQMLLEDLRMFRTQIETYRAQHDDTPPGYPNGDTSVAPTAQAFVDQMTQHTDETGQVNAVRTNAHRFGPYFRRMPKNSINDSDLVIIIGDAQALPAAPGANDWGWIYKPADNVLRAGCPGVDENGVAFITY